jgi:hypothetical protein
VFTIYVKANNDVYLSDVDELRKIVDDIVSDERFIIRYVMMIYMFLLIHVIVVFIYIV